MTIPTLQKTEEPKTFRWTREEYYRLAKLGFFNERRVELIEGAVLEMSPPLPPHSIAVALADQPCALYSEKVTSFASKIL